MQQDNAFTTAMTLILSGDAVLGEIVVLSLTVTLTALLASAIIGLPAGAALALARFPGRSFLVVAFNALMGLPPVVAGLMVYLMLSRSGPLGWLGMLFTPSAMIVAQTLLITPIIVSLTRQVVEDLWGEYEEQLRSLGSSRLQAIPTLLWDGRLSLITAILAGFGRASAEVGAILIVGREHRRLHAHHDDRHCAGDQPRRSRTGAGARHHSPGGHPLAQRGGLCHRTARAERGGMNAMHGSFSNSARSHARSLTYCARGRALVDGVSFEIGRGRRAVIMGPNGAGKSLTLRLCHGLLQPTSGSIEWSGQAGGRKRHAMVFQRPVMLRRSALANLAHALSLSGWLAAWSEPCEAHATRSPASASPNWRAGRRGSCPGGEQQRLAMARAWALDPEVLFLDEPTVGARPGRDAGGRGDDRGLSRRRHDHRHDDPRSRPGTPSRRRGPVPASRPAAWSRRRPTSSSNVRGRRPRAPSSRASSCGEPEASREETDHELHEARRCRRRAIALCAMPGPAQRPDFITVASTTSTEQSGLFGHILPIFEEKTGIEVRVIAQGTGQALETGRARRCRRGFRPRQGGRRGVRAGGLRRRALGGDVQRLRDRRARTTTRPASRAARRRWRR